MLPSQAQKWLCSPRRIGERGTPTYPKGRLGMDTENIYHLDPNYSYAVKELAFITNMSDESIRTMFEDKPGVLSFKIQSTGRRLYRTIRIPGWVAIRVFSRMTVVA